MPDVKVEIKTVQKFIDFKEKVQKKAEKLSKEDDYKKIFLIRNFQEVQSYSESSNESDIDTLYRFKVSLRQKYWDLCKSETQMLKFVKRMKKRDRTLIFREDIKGESRTDRAERYLDFLNHLLKFPRHTLVVSPLHQFLQITSVILGLESRVLMQGYLGKKLGGYYVHSNCTNWCKKLFRFFFVDF